METEYFLHLKFISKMSRKSEVVRLLGSEYCFNRISSEYSRDLAPIHPERADVVKLLMEMINRGEIYIMDKEPSVPMSASGVVGYKDNKIIIFCER